MDDAASLDFRFVAAPDVIEELRDTLADGAAATDGIAVVGGGPVRDATDLSFDLGQATELLTRVKDLMVVAGPIVTMLLAVARRRSTPKRLVVESPLGKVTIELRRDVTEAEIRDAIRRVSEL